MIYTRRILLFLTVVYAAALPDAVAQRTAGSDKHFLWKATSASTELYLLGSIHMMKESVFPLPAVIDSAFSQADALVMELDLSGLDPSSAQVSLLQRALLPTGQSLKTILPENVYTVADEKLQSFGVNLDIFDAYKPWFILLTVSAMEMQAAGFKGELGIDLHFAKKATETNKPTIGLETLHEQIDVFDSMPYDKQSRALYQALQSDSLYASHADSIVAAWKHGDAASLERLLGGSDLGEAADPLLYTRNKKWMTKLEQWLKGNERYLVVVGAAHLIGPKGLIALLREKGYKVEQL